MGILLILVWIHVRILIQVVIVWVRIVSAVVRCVHELARVVVALIRFADHVRRINGDRERTTALARLCEAQCVDDVCARSEGYLRRRSVRVRLTCRQLRGEVIHTARSATVVRNTEGNGRYS